MTEKQERALRVSDSFYGIFTSIERILDMPEIDDFERETYQALLDQLDALVSIRKVQLIAYSKETK